VFVAMVVAVAASVVALLGAGERVGQLWVGATLADDGSARVVEVIDYDFGRNSRHGIFRYVPGLRASEGVQVSSPDAPDAVTVSTSFPPQLRIGDPSRTVTGLHRYVLTYTLDGVAPGGRLAWDAVGTGWDVPIEDVEVHVTAPAELGAEKCVAGSSGSTGPCTVRADGPGHLVAAAEGLAAGEGVTVSATTGTPLDGPPSLPSPAAAPRASTTSPLVPGALAGVAALLLAALTSRLVRRSGRERMPSVGIPVTAAPGKEARIDFDELAGYASPSPSLPETLTPSQGGVLLRGSVLATHKAAWLVDEAVAGDIDLEPGDRGYEKGIVMVRLQPGDATARPLLDRAFRGRDRLPLGRYDKDFAAAWQMLGDDLTAWQRTSGLWDAAADRRTRLVRVLGTLAGILGLGPAVLGGYLSARHGVPGLVLAAAGGGLAGAGFSAAIRGWELRVLTPEGSAAWLRVESLRQFLAGSPRTAVDEAIAQGQLGRYTAWAVALGEAERWSQLASSAAVPTRSPYDTRYLRYAMYGPVFVSSCSTTSVSPSSSSGGFGGGGVGGVGGVGGGAGGGGGGSW